MAGEHWGTDTPVSMPVPPERELLVDIGGGFVFTAGGLAHRITEADIEALTSPTFAPPDPGTNDG